MDVERMGEIISAYKALIGKSQQKLALRRHKRRWDDNIKIYLRGIWRVVEDRIHVQWWCFVKHLMPQKVGNFLTGLLIFNIFRKTRHHSS
jgi:hypothetical protein